MKEASPSNLWYVNLSKQMRQLIAEEVSQKQYQFLKGRGHHGARADWDGKYRPSLLFRPSCLPVQNKRNLDVGSTEIIMVFQGVALNSTGLEGGIHFDYKKHPYRLVMGERIRSEDFGVDLLANFNSYFGMGKLQLNRGHYKQFVRHALEIIDDEIAVFHDILEDGFYVPSQKVRHAQKGRR